MVSGQMRLSQQLMDNIEWTEPLDDSQESSVNGQVVEASIQTLIEPATFVSLREIQETQFWNMQDAAKTDLIREEDGDRRPKTSLTDLQAGRDILLRLINLLTSTFRQEHEGQIAVSKADFLDHASQESLTDLLHQFGVIANKLFNMRQWVE